MIIFLAILLMVSGSAAAIKPEPVPIVKAIPAETVAMRKARGVATRDADVLLISYDGKAVARFADIRPTECAGSGTCSVWTFDRLIKVFDRPSGKVRNLALLRWRNGENPDMSVLVHSDGTLQYVDMDPVPLEKGAWLSFGRHPDFDGSLSFIDLKAPLGSGVYTTSWRCIPRHLSGETALIVACFSYDSGTGKEFKARVDHAGQKWRLTALNVKFKRREEIPERVNDIPAEQCYSLESEPGIGYQKLTESGN
jgi:hypothetical protein